MNFEGIQALDGVSFEVSAGEVIGVIGPNGAGKTTLLNVLSANLVPSGGRVTIEGTTDAEEATHRSCRRWGPLKSRATASAGRFRTCACSRDLTTFANVEIAVDSANRHRRHTEGPSTAALLTDFDLTRFADRKVSTLAQGDRRRVELARAVGLRPQFVLLDEPTAGLNDQESENLLERFRTMQQALGFGAVVVDHNIPFVMNLCQRLYVLDSGRLLASGSPSEIQDHPGRHRRLSGQAPGDVGCWPNHRQRPACDRGRLGPERAVLRKHRLQLLPRRTEMGGHGAAGLRRVTLGECFEDASMCSQGARQVDLILERIESGEHRCAPIFDGATEEIRPGGLGDAEVKARIRMTELADRLTYLEGVEGPLQLTKLGLRDPRRRPFSGTSLVRDPEVGGRFELSYR